MKKFIFAVMAALVMVSAFTSCEKKSSKDENKRNFTLSYSDLEAQSVKLTVLPADTTMPYSYGIIPENVFDVDSVAKWERSYFQSMVRVYEFLGLDATYGAIAERGNMEDEEMEISPNTAYVFYAVGIDTVTLDLTTPVEYINFTSPKIEVSGRKEMTMSDLTFRDQVVNQGWWQIFGYDGEDNDFYYLSVSPVETNKVAGSYTMQEMDAEYTYLAHYEVDADNDTTYTIIDFAEGTFEVEATVMGADMEAVVVGNDGIEYTLHVTSVMDSEAPARRREGVVKNDFVNQRIERQTKRIRR
ncbi:MAG: hypothetical protein IJ838_05855 [Paludibacteraceae bacterium]|nr:hypothetical protein [Paludibacteraceae bacterium]